MRVRGGEVGVTSLTLFTMEGDSVFLSVVIGVEGVTRRWAALFTSCGNRALAGLVTDLRGVSPTLSLR